MTFMARALSCAAAFIITASPRAQVPSPPAAAQATGTGLIAGRVVDDTGAPIPSAIVSIGRGTPASAGPGQPPAAPARASTPVLTDAQGRFFFRDLTAGSYPVTSKKPGWLDGSFGRARPDGNSQAVRLADGERRGSLSITMWKAATISGRVIDEQADPIVGAEVRLVRQTYVAGRRKSAFADRFVTDDRGAFRFPGLAPGDYCVVVPATITSQPLSFSTAMGDRPYS